MAPLSLRRSQIAALMVASAAMVDNVFDPANAKPITFDQLPENAQNQLRRAIDKINMCEITTPEDLHENWLEDRQSDGWVYGEVLDREKKTSPLLKSFSDLEPMQRIKAQISFNIANGLLFDSDTLGAVDYVED